ncbi:hypothetical protein CcaCcLH18_09184 [Colletotrichum camelliae]|nr:hypothetical protein CcaCcLH18_09184 [Colletotrichum camelliae]
MLLPTAAGAFLLCIAGVSAFDSKHDGLNTNRQLDCYRESECAFLKNHQCKPGYNNVGFDRNGYYDGPDDDARLEDRSDQRELVYKGMVLKAKSYPGSTKLHKTRNGVDAMVNSIKLSSASCSQTAIEKVNANSLSDNDKKDNWATEHAIELQFMLAFLKAVEENVLPSGRTISVLYTNFVKTAVQTGVGEKKILQPLREAIAVWRYLHEPEVNRRVQENRRLLRTTVDNISNDVSSLKLLLPVFNEMEQDYWNKAVIWTLTWLNTAIREIEDTYQQALNSGARPSNWDAVEKALGQIKKDLKYVKTLDKI